MFSALEACDFDRIRNYFEYIEIDDESRKVLEEYGIENKNKGKIPEKWCVNVDRQIAFLELEYVSPIILRTDDSECYQVYLFAVHDGYGTISFYHQKGAQESIKSPSVYWKEGWDHSKLTVPVLLALLEEAMNACEMDCSIDIHYQKLIGHAECLKFTQAKILHGVFPTILQEMFHSITEFADAELRFRSACLKHFVEWNIRQQTYNGIYLLDDEDSFFIFDFLLWAYLHISSSMEQLKHDWDNIVNKKYIFSEKHFGIRGAKENFFEKYMGKRMEEGIIVLSGDEIRFAEGYPETIINRFK
ncbi:MAG: hypothetical protein K2G45_05455 [Lachnospiraceae bacterium]|nr:hypothetical protein [Lachnospiraceae bacterium]